MNKWEKCTDENYWAEEDNIITLVKVTMRDITNVYLRDTCPYGWNVLCRMGAYKMDIEL